MNILPSVPNPQQTVTTPGGLGATTLHEAADNPLNEGGPGAKGPGLGEVITGTGDALPASVGGKPTGHGGKEAPYRRAPHGGRNQPSH